MSSLLTLTTSAFLAKLDNHPIVLHFEGLHYASDEVVPRHIAQANLERSRQTASEFVGHYMTQRHGGERKNWPQIAQQFVLAPAPYPASQSRNIPL
jgi:hypothetical protein